MFYPTLSTLAIAALSLSSMVAAASTGSTGVIKGRDGGLEGTITVVDGTTLKVTNYKLEDASAPALYWWGVAGDNLKDGFRISSEQIKDASKSDSLTIKLDVGKTAADFSTVGLWCEQFSVNFGQATLSAASGGAPPSSGSSNTSPSPPNGKTGAGAANSVPTGALGALALAAMFAVGMA